MTKITDEYFLEQQRQTAIELSTPEGAQRLRVSWLITRAMEGDQQPLIEYVKKGGEITDDLRSIFLNLLRTGKLDGQVGRGNRRTTRQIEREVVIVGEVASLEADGHQTKWAVSTVAEKHGLSEKQIYNYLKVFDSERKYIRGDND